VKICGIQGISVIDFPGRIASVVFLGGCNFRCPFCHNPGLVLRAESQPDISLDDALRTIERRRGLVDGVVVTGGEPLINGEGLFALLRMLRESGLAVKLDTNGYEIDTLRDVLETGLVDYVAMDVKTSLERYWAAAGRALDAGRIRDAIATISGSGIDHEFRTTCVPGLVELDDVRSIATLLGRNERYILQQFRATAAVVDPAYASVKPHLADTLRSFADAIRPFIGSVSLRGV
jgi:pyruvate formate lyase activating enzyme